MLYKPRRREQRCKSKVCKSIFKKMGQKAISIDEQIQLLRSRGMVINNEEKAKEVLFDVGYFRLGFYWFPFELTYPQKDNRNHQFKKGSNCTFLI